MKKIMAMFLATVMCLSLSVPAFAADVTENVAPVEPLALGGSEFDVAPAAIDVSQSFSLPTGDTWIKSFKMNKLLANPHNAFKVVISNVSGGGSYTLIIKGSNGYNFTSAPLSYGATKTVEYAAKDVTYTVYIVNNSANTVRGNVAITSYYM